MVWLAPDILGARRDFRRTRRRSGAPIEAASLRFTPVWQGELTSWHHLDSRECRDI